jgi:cell division inhibitor SulA/protein ImuA
LAPALAQVAQDAPSVWVLPCETHAGAHVAALPYPPALADAGIAIERSIFVQPATPRESLWALEQSLRTAHLGMLIGWLPPSATREGHFRALRRLQLLAQKHRALVFLLRAATDAHAPSPAVLRLQLAAAHGRLQVTVLKRRGWPLLEPVALQVHPAHWDNSGLPTAQVLPLPVAASTTSATVHGTAEQIIVNEPLALRVAA